MKYLGVDYGKVRIGLSITDEMGMIASPLRVMRATTRDENIKGLIAEADEQRVETIVVGMPIQLDGTHGIAAKAVQEFVDLLAEQADIPVETWDERLTSAQAEKAMIAADLSRRSRKKRIDAVAAQIMLQSFIDAQRFRSG